MQFNRWGERCACRRSKIKNLMCAISGLMLDHLVEARPAYIMVAWKGAHRINKHPWSYVAWSIALVIWGLLSWFCSLLRFCWRVEWKTERTWMLCRYCSATATVLVCYQHCHKPRMLHCADCCEESCVHPSQHTGTAIRKEKQPLALCLVLCSLVAMLLQQMSSIYPVCLNIFTFWWCAAKQIKLCSFILLNPSGFKFCDISPFFRNLFSSNKLLAYSSVFCRDYDKIVKIQRRILAARFWRNVISQIC